MRWFMLVLVGCASGDNKPVVVDKPVAAPVAVAPPGAAPPAKPVCSDGGEFNTARVDHGAVRACYDAQCWAYDFDNRTATPVADAGAGFEITPTKYGDPHPPAVAPVWTTKGSEPDGAGRQVWSVCGPSGCTAWKPRDLGKDEQYMLAVSESGARVGVVRGEDIDAMPEKTRVEVYDRASGKKLGGAGHLEDTCVRSAEFAGESLVVQHFGCANHGGPLTILAPSGKIVARELGFYWFDGFDRVDGDRWAFPSPHEAVMRVVDVTTGEVVKDYELQQGFTARAVDGKVYGFEPDRVTRFDVATGKLDEAYPPTCTWRWNREIAGIQWRMRSRDAIRTFGLPRTKASRDKEHSAWTFKDGVVVVMIGTPGSAAEPRVDGIELTAPSKLTTRAGIGIGSTAAQVEAAYGAHARGDGRYANPDDESGGLYFTLTDGKVSAIAMRFD